MCLIHAFDPGIWSDIFFPSANEIKEISLSQKTKTKTKWWTKNLETYHKKKIERESERSGLVMDRDRRVKDLACGEENLSFFVKKNRKLDRKTVLFS